eukprot:SAG22_NODE_4643_length_1207_cov_1.534296_1_plen_325_part_01
MSDEVPRPTTASSGSDGGGGSSTSAAAAAAGTAGKPAKLGFSLKSAPKRKAPGGKLQGAEAAGGAGAAGGGPPAEKDLLVAIGAKGLQLEKPKEKEKPKVIPSLGNSWQLHGVRQAKYAAAAGSAAAKAKGGAAVETAADQEAVKALVDDAERRKRGETGDEAEDGGAQGKMVIEGGGVAAVEGSAGSQLGALLIGRRDEAEAAAAAAAAEGSKESEDAKFRNDVEARPEEVSVDNTAAWSAMPVESFGGALLRGMGWQPGKAIGLNSKGPVAAVEYVPRHQRLGLGATPKPPEQKQKKYIKPGESREPKADLVYRDEATGQIKN